MSLAKKQLMVFAVLFLVVPASAAIGAVAPTIQAPTQAPADLVTLQWVVILALASAVGLLFRLLQLEQAKSRELLTKVLDGLATSSAAMMAMKDAADDITTLSEIRARLERIEGAKNATKKASGD